MTISGGNTASGLVLLHRRPGDAPVAIGGGIASPDQAVLAGLQTSDGGVLVRSITRQPDGSFIGEVYGVTPRQRSVARGDLVSFSESQIFTFKPADTQPMSAADAEMADMIRAFDDSFREATAPAAEVPAAAVPAEAEFSFDVAADATEDEAETRARLEGADGDQTGAAATEASAAAEPELSLAEAYSALGAAGQDEPGVQHGRVEPVMIDRTRASVPDSAPAPSPEPEPESSAGNELVLACLECGATLTLPPPADGASETPRKTTVSCRSCGRINDLAQVEAASRRRV